MKKSKLFYSDKYIEAQKRIKNFLNEQKDFLSARTITSTRAVGDAVQDLLAEKIPSLLDDVKDYSAGFARRAMADLAFNDKDDFYFVVDVKTHRLDTDFNMPNLISVERLARFYEDDKNYFVILEIAYSVKETSIHVEHVHFVPIEFLSWRCLTIGALGWGQIQISNSNKIEIIAQNPRRQWMLDLCDRLFQFYPREIEKIGVRLDYFRAVQERWLKRPE